MSQHASFIGFNAADALEGHHLSSGWTIDEKIVPPPGSTGGNFSINYWSSGPAGERGFCKVLNYWWLLQAAANGQDPVRELAEATAVYQFERDLALECVSLSRVITAVDHGSFILEGYAQPTVSYIIFEVAESDIRQLLNMSDALDTVARLRSIHNLATGVRQLHSRNIAHQDIKPSNTLVFAADDNGQRVTKVGDLGRATVAGRVASHDVLPIAGDPTYAPPEALYGDVPHDFTKRRTACDLYQIGSMIAFVFTATSMNGLLRIELHPSVLWDNWGGTYDQALPYVKDAFGRCLQRIAFQVPENIRQRVVRVVAALCHPEVEQRGWFPRIGIGSQYSLERIIAELDLLARRAELSARASL